MKKRLKSLALLFCISSSLLAQSVRFSVISDVHVMAPSLLKNDGYAFQDYITHDRKMLKESSAILKVTTRKIIENKPQFILISGDLTKDGEYASHKLLVDSCLEILKRHNIQALVIPGNHDVNNPHAVCFDGNSKQRTKTVSPEDFKRIYKDFGYEKALAKDDSSLSYVYQINDTLRILALDACRYEHNDFNKDICYHDGEFKQATLRFADEQIKNAREKGIRILCMMHHGIIEHWKYQNRMIPGYVVKDWKKISDNWAREGLEIVFTGHAHSQDIISRQNGKNKIYDIETGSTVSYPLPMRFLTLENNKLTVKTSLIKSIPGIDIDPIEYSKGFLKTGIENAALGMLPPKMNNATKKEAVNLLSDFMVLNYGGDESITKEQKVQINTMAKKIRKDSFKWSIIFKRLSKALLTDQMPKDNNLTIQLSEIK